MLNNSLCYFVDEIRTPFVINDIKRVAEKFDTVYLFSVNKLEGKETLPENVVVFEDFIDWKNFNPLKTVFLNLFSILGIYFNECIALKKLLPFKKSIALLASNIYKAECVMGKFTVYSLQLKDGEEVKGKREKDNPANSTGNRQPPDSSDSYRRETVNRKQSTFYSFWFYDCIYLAWLKKKGMISKAITRAHSGDLYEDHISIRNKLLFRNFQFKHLDKVFPVSDIGTNYLKSKYPKFENKIETIYLGSKDFGLNPFSLSDKYTIVSCASFRHHKRIHKIAEALQYFNFPIRWYHIGDERLDSNDPKIEEYKVNKEKLKENANVEYIVLGAMTNEDIFKFYKKNTINLFVSLSAIEGIPVSMMEAISFGIPVLSTDVGGCREIVTEQTGILTPLQTEMKEVAQIITEFKNSEKNTARFRKGVRAFWEENFDAKKNYMEFFKIIE